MKKYSTFWEWAFDQKPYKKLTKKQLDKMMKKIIKKGFKK